MARIQTLIIYNTLLSVGTLVAGMHLNVTLYVHCLSYRFFKSTFPSTSVLLYLFRLHIIVILKILASDKLRKFYDILK